MQELIVSALHPIGNLYQWVWHNSFNTNINTKTRHLFISKPKCNHNQQKLEKKCDATMSKMVTKSSIIISYFMQVLNVIIARKWNGAYQNANGAKHKLHMKFSTQIQVQDLDMAGKVSTKANLH